MDDKLKTNPDSANQEPNIVVPETPPVSTDKNEAIEKIAKLEEKLTKLEELLMKKEVKVDVPVATQTPVVDDFETKMAAYEKRKFEASLSADDKAKIDKIPGSASMSIETLQYILSLQKTDVPIKNFPSVTGGASTTVEPQSQDDYIKQYKEYEKSMKKGGK